MVPHISLNHLLSSHSVCVVIISVEEGKIFKVPVPRNVRLSEAPSYGMPAIYYDKYSKGAMAYCDIAKEIVEM